MGTSSITRVIVDGEVKVNQYCQFDGEPTSRGIAVLGFVRSLQLLNRYIYSISGKLGGCKRFASDADMP